MIKSQNKLAKAFHFKDCIPKELTSTVVYKFHCRLCNESHYVECLRQLNVRIGEYIGIIRKLSLGVSDGVRDHLLLCNRSPSFERFSVLTKENRKFVLEFKESILKVRGKPSLNKSIRSTPL